MHQGSNSDKKHNRGKLQMPPSPLHCAVLLRSACCFKGKDINETVKTHVQLHLIGLAGPDSFPVLDGTGEFMLGGAEGG